MLAALLAVALAGAEPPPEPAADQARRLTRDALTLYGLGLIQQRSDRLVEAARTLEDAVRLDPEAVAPRLALVPLYNALGRPDDATRAAAAVLLIDPSQADTWRTLARLLHEQKRTPEAISVLTRGVATPQLADRPADRIAAYRDLGSLLAAVGAHAKAADAYRQGLALFAKHRDELRLKREAADLDCDRGELEEGLGAACLAAKQFDAALGALTEARSAYGRGGDKGRAARVATKQAAALAGLGETARAQTVLDQYLTTRPRDLDAFALKAKLLRDAGDGGTVPVVLAGCVQADPDYLPLQVLLGDECRRLRDTARAERAYRGVIERTADVAAYRGLFALLSGPGGSPARLFAAVDDVARRAAPPQDENREDADTKRAREDARHHLRAIVQALGQEPAAAGLLLTTAVEELRQVRGFGRGRGMSSPSETWRTLAVIAERAGQLTTAEELFRGALADFRSGQRSDVYAALFRVLWAARKRQEIVTLGAQALREIEQGVGRGRGQIPVVSLESPHFHMALALAQLGRIDDALRHADEAVKAAQGPNQLVMRLRRVEVLRHAERLDEAEAECRRLFQEFSQPADVRRIKHTLANVYSTGRRWDQAEEQLRAILELDPGDATAHNDLGYQLADQGRRLDEAERLVRRALELDRAKAADDAEDGGENAAYLDSLGWVLFRRGRLPEARALLERSAALPEGAADPVVWDHLGDVLARLALPAEAATAWGRARELFRTEKRSLHDPRGDEVERKLKRVTSVDSK